MTSQYAEDTAIGGALPEGASSEDEGVRSEEPETIGSLTFEALMDRLKADPKFYDTVKGHAQREANGLLRPVAEKLGSLETEQSATRQYLLEQDRVLQQYMPAWERYVEELDPSDRQALKQQTETRTQAQLVKALAAQQAQGGTAPPRGGDTRDVWQRQLREAYDAPRGAGDRIKTYAEGKGVSYDRLYDHMTTNSLWPSPEQGQPPASFMLDIIDEAKKVADTLASDMKKRDAPAVKAGADSRGGGVGKPTWEQVHKLALAGDPKADKLLEQMLAAAK